MRAIQIGLAALIALGSTSAVATAQTRIDRGRIVTPAPEVRGGVGRIAFDNGYRDGYAEGLNDGRRRHRNDPFAESRYRSANHGYEWRFGRVELYRVDYRRGFESGYERGYREGNWRRW